MYEHDVCVDSNNLFQSLYETTLRVKGMYVKYEYDGFTWISNAL